MGNKSIKSTLKQALRKTDAICRNFFLVLFHPITQITYRYMGYTNIITYIGFSKESHLVIQYTPTKDELTKNKQEQIQNAVAARKKIYAI